MPLCEEPDPVDIVRLAAVDRLEVVETIEWVESGVVGELLPGDWFFGLQAKDCVDVFLLLDVCEGSPSSKDVSIFACPVSRYSIPTIPSSQEDSRSACYASAPVMTVQEQCEVPLRMAQQAQLGRCWPKPRGLLWCGRNALLRRLGIVDRKRRVGKDDLQKVKQQPVRI